MVQNSNIVAAPDPPHHNFFGSLPSHITYYCTSTATHVSPTARPTGVPPTDPLLTIILLPCADTKEVPITPPSRPPHHDLRHVFHTFSLSLTLGTV